MRSCKIAQKTIFEKFPKCTYTRELGEGRISDVLCGVLFILIFPTLKKLIWSSLTKWPVSNGSKRVLGCSAEN